MIWNREGKIWYSKELIDKIKEICHKRPYNAIEKVLKMIEETEK